NIEWYLGHVCVQDVTERCMREGNKSCGCIALNPRGEVAASVAVAIIAGIGQRRIHGKLGAYFDRGPECIAGEHRDKCVERAGIAECTPCHKNLAVSRVAYADLID